MKYRQQNASEDPMPNNRTSGHGTPWQAMVK